MGGRLKRRGYIDTGGPRSNHAVNYSASDKSQSWEKGGKGGVTVGIWGDLCGSIMFIAM